MELWDEETADRRPQHRHLHAAGDGVSVRDDGRGDARDPARGVGDRHARQVSGRARRRALDHGAGRRRRGGEASRPVGAADRRARRSARVVHGHAAQPRVRDAPRARVRAGRRRSASAACRPRKPPPRRRCRPTIFYDYNMRQDPNWIDRVVESLGDTVYITIDCDGLDPAIMPATGTPEPGGLSLVRGAGAAAAGDRAADGRRLRHRGAVADAGQRRAELSLREAGLQDPVVPVRRQRSEAARALQASYRRPTSSSGVSELAPRVAA